MFDDSSVTPKIRALSVTRAFKHGPVSAAAFDSEAAVARLISVSELQARLRDRFGAAGQPLIFGA